MDGLDGASATRTFHRNPVIVARENPFVQALGAGISRVVGTSSDQISVGRHGASDAASFLAVGVPAVECGPTGGGHHGPDEWVSIRSLGQYRKALVEFVNLLPARLDAPGEDGRHLRIA